MQRTLWIWASLFTIAVSAGLADSQPPTLDINGATQWAAGQIRDEEIERDVKKALDTPTFKDITVDVKNGVVQLTGTVSSWAWRLEAVAAARAVPGVRTVEDELRLMLGV